MKHDDWAMTGESDSGADEAMVPDEQMVLWIAEQADRSHAFGVACADALERQATTLLNGLVLMAGGAVAYGLSLFEKGAAPWQWGGMATVALWCAAVAAGVTMRCLWSQELYGPANDPANLQRGAGFSLLAVRRAELGNRQFCIDQNRQRNDRVGRALNLCRLATAMTPLVFASAALLVAAF